MGKLTAFFIIFLHFSKMAYSEPIIPEDVLSNEEIADILNSRNLFFRRDLPDQQPTWDRWSRQYGSHFLQAREQFFTIDQVVKKTLADGFPIRYRIEDLFRAGMDQHIAWGNVIPRISLTVGQGASPLDVNNVFSNLFGFVMPHHWLFLSGRRMAYKASKYLFLKTALDEVLASELAFLKVHKSIQDFEILNFYFIHLQLLTRLFPSADRELQALKARFGNEGSQMALKRGETKIGFDDLAIIMALEKGEQGDYSASKINIRNLENFPTEVKKLRELEEEYQSKEKFIRTVVSRSVELRSIREFYNIAKLNIGITASGNIFANRDARGSIGNDARFGISAGYDTLPRILRSSSEMRSARIDVQDQYLNILDIARRSHDLYTNSFGLFTETTRSLELNREAFKSNLQHVIDETQTVDGLFILSFLQMVDAELKMNQAFHVSLQAKANMKRLLVTKESSVLDYLPSKGEVEKVRRFFGNEYDLPNRKIQQVDNFVRSLRKTKDLKHFLKGIFQYKGTHYNLSPDEVREAIVTNSGFLIYSKQHFSKSRKYYRTLYDYVKSNEVNLTEFEMRTLYKKANSVTKRWFSKKYSKEIDSFQEHFDFEDFDKQDY